MLDISHFNTSQRYHALLNDMARVVQPEKIIPPQITPSAVDTKISLNGLDEYQITLIFSWGLQHHWLDVSDLPTIDAIAKRVGVSTEKGAAASTKSHALQKIVDTIHYTLEKTSPLSSSLEDPRETKEKEFLQNLPKRMFASHHCHAASMF